MARTACPSTAPARAPARGTGYSDSHGATRPDPRRVRGPLGRNSGAGCRVHRQVLGQCQIARLARHPVEAHQGQLDLLVARVAALLPRLTPEHCGDIVHLAAHDVEEQALARALIIGHRRLDEMARTVELVQVAQIGPAPARLDRRKVGVQVAIRLLRRGDESDQPSARPLAPRPDAWPGCSPPLPAIWPHRNPRSSSGRSGCSWPYPAARCRSARWPDTGPAPSAASPCGYAPGVRQQPAFELDCWK
jgi:hypothetical protein